MSKNGCSAMEQWLCPVCQEIVFKPIASPCGHIFCFWCIHRSMSPFQASACPICRSSFCHFPSIIPMLHKFLEASFPEEYKKRAEEARHEEKETDIASPQEICTGRRCVESKPVGEGGPSSNDFACDACDMLVYKPLILNCGHVVCNYHVDVSHGNKGHCPACHVAFHGETVCTQLWDWMTRVFPEQCEERKRQLSGGKKVQGFEKSIGTQIPLPGMEDDQEMEDDTNEQGTSEEDKDYPEDFTHFGVGCDLCGQYPIIGQRYKCLDCPESVGFDLCKDCLKHANNRVGRFNQKHQPNHRLELVPPLMTKLHTIKELHPDLDYNRLLSLIEMAWEDHTSNPPPQAEQQLHEEEEEEHQEAHEESDRGDGPMTDGSFMMRPRGPRPHQQE